MPAARCATCGEPVRYYGVQRGVFTNKETGERTKTRPAKNPGWIHAEVHGRDSITGHRAVPNDERTPEADMTRQTGAWDQAESHVTEHLQKGFDYLHAKSTVDDLFKDRRGS